ncbi:hypothetical protein AURDEDRAFT_169047 [Auricularia subglabra TFB-10046 SS5]|nr:hypothetical protein AURDEDRAFT_169047 [Auricularia subglabra TFB-10046 SS5]
MNPSRSPSPVLRLSSLAGPLVPVADIIGSYSSSSLRSLMSTPPRSPSPAPVLTGEIIISAPYLRRPEKDPPIAPRPVKGNRRAGVVLDLERAVSEMSTAQDTSVARLPAMMDGLTICDQEVAPQDQGSRKRAREATEDALEKVMMEHRARKQKYGQYWLPSKGSSPSSQESSRARQPSHGTDAHAAAPRASPPSLGDTVDIGELEDREYDADDDGVDPRAPPRTPRTGSSSTRRKRRV